MAATFSTPGAGTGSGGGGGAVELLELAGRLPTRRSPTDPAIVVEAGWGRSATIHAEVRLRTVRPLRDARILAELQGHSETRWVRGQPAGVAAAPSATADTGSGGVSGRSEAGSPATAAAAGAAQAEPPVVK
ncbi:hypothetical protein HK405_002350, partial [Cladochytrium tenue]